jgi:hypothetical protein
MSNGMKFAGRPVGELGATTHDDELCSNGTAILGSDGEIELVIIDTHHPLTGGDGYTVGQIGDDRRPIQASAKRLGPPLADSRVRMIRPWVGLEPQGVHGGKIFLYFLGLSLAFWKVSNPNRFESWSPQCNAFTGEASDFSCDVQPHSLNEAKRGIEEKDGGDAHAPGGHTASNVVFGFYNQNIHSLADESLRDA